METGGSARAPLRMRRTSQRGRKTPAWGGKASSRAGAAGSERSEPSGSGARRAWRAQACGDGARAGGVSARTRALEGPGRGRAPTQREDRAESGVGTQRDGEAAANQLRGVSGAGQSARGASPAGQSAPACGILPLARESRRPVPEPQPISAQESRAASGRGLGDVLQAHRARPRQLRSSRHQQQRQPRPRGPARRHECPIAIRICPWSLCPLPAPLQRLWPPVHGLRAGHEATRFPGLPEHIH